MADFTALKTAIQTYVKQNGNEEITGDILQGILLSIVTTLGDNAINNLQETVDSISSLLENGAVYCGIATPSTNPGTPTTKVFYIALQAGTYTNFGNLSVVNGVTILSFNGSTWSKQLLSYGDGVFDISEYKATGGTLATFTDLAAAIGTDGANVPVEVRKGGMSVKFVQSSDNNYVQFRLMTKEFSPIAGNWQKVVNNQLEVKLQGITAEETKISLVENSNWYDGKYVSSDGKIKNSETPVGGVPHGILIINVSGCKKVRFLGYKSINETTVGYGFSENVIDPTSDAVQLNATAFSSGASTDSAFEYIVDVPEGMNYFACTIRKWGTPQTAVMTINDFYCYTQTGNTVKDELEDSITDIKTTLFKYTTLDIAFNINKVVSNSGLVNPSNGWAYNDYIALSVGTKFSFSENANNYGIWAVNFYNANHTWISQHNWGQVNHEIDLSTLTIPEGTVFINFDIWNGSSSSALTPSDITDWYLRVHNNNSLIERVENLENDIYYGGSILVNLDVTEKLVKITSELSQNYNIENTMNWKDDDGFSYNPCANFAGTTIIKKSNGLRTRVNSEDDNISATHTQVGWIGANHGMYRLERAAVTSHGKTFVDIGSKWSKSDKVFVLVSIIDNNTLGFIPMYTVDENGITYFEGTLSSSDVLQHVSGATHTGNITVESSATDQWYPSEKTISRKYFIDGKEIIESGTYSGELFDLIEVYDVIDPASYLDKIIAAVGTLTANPLPRNFSGLNTWIRYCNDYKFAKGGLNILSIDWIVMSKIGFYQFFPLDVKIMNATSLGGNLQYYLPKALPITKNDRTYDYRVPVPYLSVNDSLEWTSQYWENLLLPPDRAIEFIDNGTKRIIGLHHGYVFDQGVCCGENRKDYLNNAWWIYTSRASYNGALDTKIGSILNKGVHYGIVCFRKYEDYTDNPNGLISLSHFEVNGRYYIYADFEAAGEYNLEIPAKWNGREITILEKSSNVQLISSIAVSPILAIVSNANPMYGYLVMEIKPFE